MGELHISVDVETDGPIPGPHSMLSLGAAAFLEGMMVGTFEVNLECLEGATPDPDTMEWWSKQPRDVWEDCRKDAKAPAEAMRSFVNWVNRVASAANSKPVCTAYPAGFDFLFVHWYAVKFTGSDPFGFNCVDMRSYAMGKLNVPFSQSSKKNLPGQWTAGLPPHDHRAVNDAIEQGCLFRNMVNAKH